MVEGWNVVEDESYERCVAQISSHEEMDPILEAIVYALQRNPSGFPETVVPGVHLAKTKLRIFGADYVPSYRLWFRVDAEARTVHKLWVETAPPEDMGFGTTFNDDEDEIPF